MLQSFFFMEINMNYLGIFLRGLAMGAADIVPGVSGGTIAFITGIYNELIRSIKSIDLDALRCLKSQGVRAFWQQINGSFLLSLGLGILTAIALFANLIHYLLTTYPEYLWSFFFGLILASAFLILRQIARWHLSELLAIIIGFVFASFISLATPMSVQSSYLVFFLAGSLAICAMILPGISGSFILLLMGLYVPILEALKGFELSVIGVFALGAIFGLALFVRLLSYLLTEFPNTLLALLTGFMLGALFKVWPWKETISTRINSKGELVPFIQENRLPDITDYESLLLCLMMCALGMLLVVALEFKQGARTSLHAKSTDSNKV